MTATARLHEPTTTPAPEGIGPGDDGWRLPARAFLRRIGHRGPVTPTADSLRALTTATLRAVPYEMLDALEGRPTSLHHPDVFAKLVHRRQGGTCLETTPLLGRFLREAGFPVRLVAAQIWRVKGGWAPRWDHLILLVEADGAEWVVDAGFFMMTALEPLPTDGAEHTHDGWTHRVATADGHRAVLRRTPGGDWIPVYRFAERHLETADCTWVVDYHMAAADSPLTANLLCSRVIPGGKLILMRKNFIRAENGRENIDFLATERAAEKAIAEIFHGHDGKLAERALRLWNRTRGKRAGKLPGIG
ncbi:arylamine N-acetyltransferase [Streptomyces sp. NPDC000594]|uniref:arylamine N-acetyltransferase family protein n=1 Tax=Streptomyces sp. NPDC000594 TaxID=3154261 RepID=UPI00331FF76E